MIDSDDGHMTDFDRFGIITASLVSAIIRTPDETRSRKWAWRVITGREPDKPVWKDIERGLEHEDDAITVAEVVFGTLCHPGRFVKHRDIAWLGASPDGFIELDGILVPVEAKCPRQLHTFCPPKYVAQVQTQLECCDAPFGIFISWVEDSDAQYVERVYRDPVWWNTNYPVMKEFYETYVVPDVEPPVSTKRGKKPTNAEKMAEQAEMLKEK